MSAANTSIQSSLSLDKALTTLRQHGLELTPPQHEVKVEAVEDPRHLGSQSYVNFCIGYAFRAGYRIETRYTYMDRSMCVYTKPTLVVKVSRVVPYNKPLEQKWCWQLIYNGRPNEQYPANAPADLT